EALAAFGPGAVVAAYWPVGAELDPRALARALQDRHAARLALPRVDGEQMTFRAWRRDEDLEPAGFHTMGPARAAPELRPDIVLAPLLGCDRRGGRLGQGKGYYDRALAGLDAGGDLFVGGVAFDAQLLPAVPTEVHDRRLDAVLTEREWIALSGG
ncbi:MAG: 5-formyltetrahydrofolate cyclo-ligase, partial [Planctomycetota bacterium]